MDVSTLFAAPSTAASATALSFGVQAGNGGSAGATGDGLEGLDSFNQLLGNFLAVTGGEATGLTIAADGSAAPEVESASVTPTLSQGTTSLTGAGLLKGFGPGLTQGPQVQNGRPVEGRWAQSGLNLLAGGGLTGQEINPEVIAFLNDLSQAIAGQGEGQIDIAPASTAEPVVESEATERLVVLQGDSNAPAPTTSATITQAAIASSAAGSIGNNPVIPKGDVISAPGQLGITLTVEGTGLTVLPTAMAVEDVRLPTSSPVIPRALPTAQPATQQAVPATPRMTVGAATTDQTIPPQMIVAAAPAPTITDEVKTPDGPVTASAPSTEPDTDEDLSAPVMASVSPADIVSPPAVQPSDINEPMVVAGPTIVPSPAIQPSEAGEPMVVAEADKPSPAMASSVVAMPAPDAVETAATEPTSNTTSPKATAAPRRQAAAADTVVPVKDEINTGVAASTPPAPSEKLAATAVAMDDSRPIPAAPVDPELADDHAAAASAPSVDVGMAALSSGTDGTPRTAVTAPLTTANVDNPAPTQKAVPPMVMSADNTTRPTQATIVAAATEHQPASQGMPDTQGLTAPSTTGHTAAQAPAVPDVETVTAEQAGPAAVSQPDIDGQGRLTMSQTEAPPPPKSATPAPAPDQSGPVPARQVPPVVTTAATATDRVAALVVPAELVTQAIADVPATLEVVKTDIPVETTRTPGNVAPMTAPLRAPGKMTDTTTVATASPENGDASTNTPTTPTRTAETVPADIPSMDQPKPAPQVGTPVDPTNTRIVIEPAPKSATDKPVVMVAASDMGSVLVTTEAVIDESSPVVAEAETIASASATPKPPVSGVARATVTISRTVNQTAQTPRAQLAPSEQQVNDQTVSDDPADDVDATNQKMLAPKHVNEESRLAEVQSDFGSPAQSAGQNNAAARPDTVFVRAVGGAEDNLLAHAVSAAAKGHESNSTGDEGSGADPEQAAQTLDSLTNPTSGGETAKAQNSDFAQSLRQTTSPHRANAYMHPTHQMAMQVQRAIQDGNERLSIRLNPQELGRIDVQLEIGSEGKLRAKVMVENPQTLEMLQKDAKSLEKALQDAGLQTDQDSLSFSLQDNGDQAQQRQDQPGQSGHGTAIASVNAEQEDPAILAQTQILELGRVDVVV